MVPPRDGLLHSPLMRGPRVITKALAENDEGLVIPGIGPSQADTRPL